MVIVKNRNVEVVLLINQMLDCSYPGQDVEHVYSKFVFVHYIKIIWVAAKMLGGWNKPNLYLKIPAEDMNALIRLNKLN